MPLHLIKLCVGIEHVDELAKWQNKRWREKRELQHITRMTPRRQAELLAGGSLYWVIKGYIQARQKLVELRPLTGAEGVARCALILDPNLVRTRPQPRRPFQGWRYLASEEAPPDLPSGKGKTIAALPAEMAAELMQLGLL